MSRNRFCVRTAERGSALFLSLLFIVLLVGVTGVLVTYSQTSARASGEVVSQAASFYLAERGMAQAEWELARGEDSDGDGVGAVSGSATQGTFTVTVTDLGSSQYQLRSTGLAGGTQTTIVETIQLAIGGGNSAPITAIGDNSGNDPVWEFSGDTHLMLDGGSGPALLLSDSDFHSGTTSQWSDAMSDGYLNAAEIVGGADTGVDAIAVDAAGEGATIYPSLYSDLYSFADGLYAPPDDDDDDDDGGGGYDNISGNESWGTSGSPVIKRLHPYQTIGSGSTVSGYGTLIIPEDLEMESGSTLDWTGDVIVIGRAGNDAAIRCQGDISVTGNLVLIGDAGRDIKFEAKTDSSITVTGSLTAVTDYADTSTKAEVLVEGPMNITGYLTIAAGIHQTEFKGTSDTMITGSLQLGVYGNQMKLKVESDLEIVNDAAAMANALSIMSAGFPTLSLPGGSGGTGSGAIQRFGWHVSPGGP